MACLVVALAMYGAVTAAAFEPTSTAAEGPALADAQARLAAFVPPPGAQPVASPPEGVKAPEGTTLDPGPNWLDAKGYWLDSEAPGTVQTYLAGYTPPEARLFLTGSGTTAGVFDGGFVAYKWPDLPDIATARALNVAFAPTPGGGTIISADSQSVWLEPRLASSDIPATAHFVEVTETHGGTVRKGSTSNPHRVAALRTLANSLLIAQPSGPMTCPEIPADPHILQTVFRRAAGTPVLAKLVQPWPMDACNVIELTVRGTSQRNLIGGNELARRLRLLLSHN